MRTRDKRLKPLPVAVRTYQAYNHQRFEDEPNSPALRRMEAMVAAMAHAATHLLANTEAHRRPGISSGLSLQAALYNYAIAGRPAAQARLQIRSVGLDSIWANAQRSVVMKRCFDRYAQSHPHT